VPASVKLKCCVEVANETNSELPMVIVVRLVISKKVFVPDEIVCVPPEKINWELSVILFVIE
jgi:hypothetical protein